MRVDWFKNQDNVVYADVDKFCDNFGKEIGIKNLRQKIDQFREDPVKDGVSLKGTRRTSILLFVPNMLFNEKIEMGDTVWVYMGESYECYCLYWNE